MVGRTFLDQPKSGHSIRGKTRRLIFNTAIHTTNYINVCTCEFCHQFLSGHGMCHRYVSRNNEMSMIIHRTIIIAISFTSWCLSLFSNTGIQKISHTNTNMWFKHVYGEYCRLTYFLPHSFLFLWLYCFMYHILIFVLTCLCLVHSILIGMTNSIIFLQSFAFLDISAHFWQWKTISQELIHSSLVIKLFNSLSWGGQIQLNERHWHNFIVRNIGIHVDRFNFYGV